MTDAATRQEFKRLTQRLVDITIEIVDLADGDPDLEVGFEELEDDDGI